MKQHPPFGSSGPRQETPMLTALRVVSINWFQCNLNLISTRPPVSGPNQIRLVLLYPAPLPDRPRPIPSLPLPSIRRHPPPTGGNTIGPHCAIADSIWPRVQLPRPNPPPLAAALPPGDRPPSFSTWGYCCAPATAACTCGVVPL